MTEVVFVVLTDTKFGTAIQFFHSKDDAIDSVEKNHFDAQLVSSDNSSMHYIDEDADEEIVIHQVLSE